MLLNTGALLVASFLATALAASSSTTASSAPSSTSSTAIATHTIIVGEDGLHYTPDEVFANVGDIIEYRFFPQNHSVARSSFGPQPCIPYEYTAGIGAVGFWSGFRPVAAVLSDPPIFSVRVNDTEPIFFYCSAPGACLDNGMIGVINPNSTFTLAQQLNYTMNATIEFSPMENFPTETAAGTRTLPTATATSTATTSAAAVSSGKSGLGTGPIVGIAIGAIAVLVLACALLYMCGRQRTVKELLRQSTIAPHANHNSYQPSAPGFSEAKYPNMIKSPNLEGECVGGFGPGTETESYRSLSPLPVDERTGMMAPSVFSGNGLVSPATGTWNGYEGSPNTESQRHEMDQSIVGTPQTFNLQPTPPQPQIHELPDTGSNLTPQPNETRPFSYTRSESGYRNEKRP